MDDVIAPWSCEMCGRSGIASGPSAAPSETDDPIPLNCYFCQATIVTRLPAGMARTGLRVEGEYALPADTRCPDCRSEMKGYWDERGTPLAMCRTCTHRARLPPPWQDPEDWEVLLHTDDEKIERRRARGGWTFRSESRAGTGWHRASYKTPSQHEAFEPEPGRPLADIFRDIREQHLKLREEERRRRTPRPRD